MLFDLRGRHRRRAVRVIYTGLAVLMGVGLVGFGIGGGFGGGGGGLLNAASNNEGANAASFSNQIKKYEKLTKEQPQNASAWENLANAELHEAGGEAFVSSAGVTTKGKELFARVAQAWNSYIALNPAKPNAELAERMVTVFGEEGLNEPAAEVAVLQIAVAARPTSAALYASLAESAYKAHNTSVGDLAAAKAVSLAPAAERARLKTELETVKKNPTGAATTEAATSKSGEKFTLTKGANGSIKAAKTPTSTTGTSTTNGQSSTNKK
jgi:hypothetical protein